MSSLKPKQSLVYDALLLAQPFFELHLRHHQSRRHYSHHQNHAFHNENSSLIYFFSSTRRHALNIKCLSDFTMDRRTDCVHLRAARPCPGKPDGTFPTDRESVVRLLCETSPSLNDIPMLGKTGLSNVNFGNEGLVFTDVLLVDFV